MRESGSLSFCQLATLAGNRLGIVDAPCPLCSPLRRPANRRKRVLRIWRERADVLTYCCVHCGVHGLAHDRHARPIDRNEVARRMREADRRPVEHVRERRRRAGWLWSHAQPIEDTPAERYLRGRGITGPLPATLRFLPARGDYPPAMIGVFGIPSEPAPAVLDVDGIMVHGIHITRVQADGRGKAPDHEGCSKIMVGSCVGLPIVVAPASDSGGLAIAEGIEDALSLAQVLGLGGWAAGCASRLPHLACAVPHYVESVTILVDPDTIGRRHSRDLADRLAQLRDGRLDICMLDASSGRAVA